ncbi:unnamed protein product [Linum trigynum]|uniref:Secreted protein n=1 Tax=Linum trigynum TaxID=586398 RepID=A0AAV2GD79_9ROSI
MSSTPSRRLIFATISVVVSSTRWGNEREDRGPSSSPRSIFATTSWHFQLWNRCRPFTSSRLCWCDFGTQVLVWILCRYIARQMVKVVDLVSVCGDSIFDGAGSVARG